MSSMCGDWAALASKHERLVRADVNDRRADHSPQTPGPAPWAELASQRERLVEADDPLYGLVSSPRRAPGFRLAVSAA